MKNTGIVRRLDELGRIVIPREFRKSHGINVGDPLEIFATENGEIIIKKVDYTSDLTKLCETACYTLTNDLGFTVACSNFERILASSGTNRQLLIDKELPAVITKMLKGRGFYNGQSNSDEIGKMPDIGFGYICITPILSLDDCFGSVMAFSKDLIGLAEVTALKLAGRLIGEALQRF